MSALSGTIECVVVLRFARPSPACMSQHMVQESMFGAYQNLQQRRLVLVLRRQPIPNEY